MSWIRWSSICNNGKLSDLYIYEDISGSIALHIAKARRKNIENAPQLDITNPESYQEYREWLKSNKDFESIDLEYAGESFYFDDTEELISMLEKLKSLGYNFNDYVFELARDCKL